MKAPQLYHYYTINKNERRVRRFGVKIFHFFLFLRHKKSWYQQTKVSRTGPVLCRKLTLTQPPANLFMDLDSNFLWQSLVYMFASYCIPEIKKKKIQYLGTLWKKKSWSSPARRRKKKARRKAHSFISIHWQSSAKAATVHCLSSQT